MLMKQILFRIFRIIHKHFRISCSLRRDRLIERRT